MRSPHAGLVTSTMIAGGGSSPTLRGLRKWSSARSEYIVFQLSLMHSQGELIVVAAVIERDGKILICQRKPSGRHPLKWEFPGGKAEPREDPAAALKRELREELAIDADIGAELAQHAVRYGDGPLIQL